MKSDSYWLTFILMKKTATKVLQLSSMNLAAQIYAQELEEMTAQPFTSHYSSDGKAKDRTKKEQIRDRAFSKKIRDNYQHRCSVCRNKVITPKENVLAEGAHIIPWSVSFNDDPRNGISLCRNHHWLFDKLMFTVRPDYTVKISPWLNKNGNNLSEKESLKGRAILLPEKQRYYPAVEALDHHNYRFDQYHKKL